MKKIVGLLAMALLLWTVQSQPAMAACRAIDNPTADYTMNMGTERCSLGTTSFANVNVCKDPDGNTEAKFSNALSTRQVPNGWATWSSPPFAETSTPWVGYNSTNTLTVTLADGYQASTVGMEIEPNSFEPAFNVSAVFRDLANTTLLTVTRSVLGRAGARLFAVTCDEELINSVVISTNQAAQGFAIAKIRSDSFVVNNAPEAGPTGTPSINGSGTSNAQGPDTQKP